jgi:hypothetical protein
MDRESRFRTLLPVVQSMLAAGFGGFGLRKRSAILSRPILEGQTLWDTTASLHVWPWPFKFAVISNLPAFLADAILSWPLGAMWPRLPEAAQLAPSLLFVLVLWYCVGSWLDRRWDVLQKTPWTPLAIFTAVCFIGAIIPLGYSGYLPYAALVWLVMAMAFRRTAKLSAQERS